MSPRRSKTQNRSALVDIAARLLAGEGPEALSARRIAAEAGSSTMAVYTHFGGMSGLVREMVYEGFARLETYFAHVGRTGDPVADMTLFGRAYRHNALTNAHLYAVMFGGASLGGFSLSAEDRQYGRYTLSTVVECATRCIEAGRFRTGDAELVANQLWTAIHGLVTLELGDYLIAPCDADRVFEAQLVTLMVGVGDTVEAATRSVASSAPRLAAEVHPARPPVSAGPSPATGRPA
ncbi:TetR family transcriptional regulator [Sphaerisporangium krabiense]|uniref:AcrR family transcriptional regulator n=1 Tax=Sphaerisporangium krabiense TaxID=763782 RepID=A0A7W8ZCC1_9ACTN|nr:TetR/AcrR family transcriptional regulator [Sphaerisporangium krabiense]MBB5631280.1 AcrR family transcriptional regulator [Sphaerisporangium krabiense]GII61107.1 TetR family transcriptional regulator [Sphaerisporangium krabiense]